MVLQRIKWMQNTDTSVVERGIISKISMQMVMRSANSNMTVILDD